MKTCKILIVCSLAAALLLLVAAGCSGPAVSQKPATATNAPSGQSAFIGSVTQAVQNYQEGVEPTTQIPPTGPAEAQAKSGVAVKLPKDNSVTGNLKAVYPDTSASGNAENCLHFNNGVLLSEEAWKDKPDFAHEIAQDSDPKYHDPPVTAGSNWTLVKVAGFDGKMLPQPAILGADGKVQPLPPILEWWADGVRYRLSVWKAGFTGNQLLRIANSMY